MRASVLHLVVPVPGGTAWGGVAHHRPIGVGTSPTPLPDPWLGARLWVQPRAPLRPPVALSDVELLIRRMVGAPGGSVGHIPRPSTRRGAGPRGGGPTTAAASCVRLRQVARLLDHRGRAAIGAGSTGSQTGRLRALRSRSWRRGRRRTSAMPRSPAIRSTRGSVRGNGSKRRVSIGYGSQLHTRGCAPGGPAVMCVLVHLRGGGRAQRMSLRLCLAGAPPRCCARSHAPGRKAGPVRDVRPERTARARHARRGPATAGWCRST
jgi:hypothetical protein